MKKMRILIVQRDGSLPLWMSEQLAAFGGELIGVTSCIQEALSLSERRHPDLVLMDTDLSGRDDGTEAAKTIWQRFSIPVVLTCDCKGGCTHSSVRPGPGMDHIRKPFHVGELRTALNAAMDGRGVHSSHPDPRRGGGEEMKTPRATLDGFWMVDLTGRLSEVNDAYCHLSGYTREELLGIGIWELEAGATEAQITEEIGHIQSRGGARWERKHRCKDGRLVDIEISVTCQTSLGDRLVCLLRDITERKHNAAILEARYRLTCFSPGHPLSELLREVLDEAEKLTRSSIGFYHFLEADQTTLTLQAWSTNTVQNVCTAKGDGLHYTVDQAGVWADCIRKCRPVVHNDYAALPHRKGLPPGHAPIVRQLLVPVQRGGVIMAILGVGNKPTDYTDEDIRVASQLADFAWDIVQLKRSGDALLSSQRLLAKSQEIARVGSWELELDSNRLTWSDEVYRIFGLDPRTFHATYEAFLAVVHPADRIAVDEAYRRSLKEKADFYEIQHRIIRPTGGEIRYVHEKCEHHKDASGRIVRSLGMVQDITDWKSAESAFRQSEERFQHVIEASHDWVWEVDHTGVYTYSSPRCQEFLGYTPEEIVGKTPFDLMPPAEAERLRAVFQSHVSARKPFLRLENINRHKDGHEVVVETNGVPVLDAGGRFLGYRGTDRDITARRQVEEKLAKERMLLRSVIDNIPFPIYAKDVHARKILANVADVRNIGAASEADVLGKDDFALFPGENAVKYHATDQTVLRTGQPALGILDAFPKPSGQTTWLLSSKIPFLDDHGKVIGLVGIGRDVTQQIQAEEKLREANRLLEEAQNAAFLGSYALDITTGEWTSSKSLDRIFGIESVDFVRDVVGWLSLVHPAERNAMQDYFTQHVLAGRNRFDREYRIVRVSDGEERWVRGLGWLDVNEQGKAERMIGSIQDITASKRLEVALRESEERFRTLIDQAGDGVELLDMEGRFVGFNQATLRQLGLCREELAQMTVFDVDPHLSKDLFEQRSQALSSGSPVRIESLHRRKDGTLFPVEIIASKVQLQGQAHLLTVVRDISERKQAEERIRKLSRAVEQSPSSIVITDPVGAIEYVNPAFTHVTGYSMAEVLGQNPRILKGKENPAGLFESLWQTIKQGREWRGDLQNRKKSGEYYWEHASIAPILDEEGRITHFLAVKEDISERRLLEQQYRQAQKLEAVGHLAGGVAHDFNNMLAAMMMHLGLLQQNAELEPEMKDSLKELMIEARRAAGLTRQLLLFSRRSVMEARALDMNEVVGNLLKLLGRLIGEHIELRFARGAALPLVNADPTMIEQVLMNLVVNARDAMPKGGTVTIGLTPVDVDETNLHLHVGGRPGRFVCLSVSDNGLGMDEATLGRIFEPFFTTKEVGKGTGLGLATVYGIVGQHQGWIEVESQVGRGSCFRTFLPATSVESLEAVSGEMGAAIRGCETVLLVEDDATVQWATSQGLRLLGYRVLTAKNGQDALKLWRRHHQEIALLLSDMVMPGGLTGLDLAEECLNKKPGLRVIISSGYSADMPSQLQHGRKDFTFLRKPYELAELSRIVRQSLDQT